MRLYLLILYFGILLLNKGYSQSPDASDYLFGELQQVDRENAPNDLILPVKTNNGDWRFINSQGGFYNSERFQWADIPKKKGEVIVKKGDLFGIVNYNAPVEVIFDGKSNNFTKLLDFSYDTIHYDHGLYLIKRKGKYDLYDTKNRFSNVKADSIQYYNHFFKFWKEGKIGLIDSNCREIIPADYEFLRFLNKKFIVLGNSNQTLSAYSIKTGTTLARNFQSLTIKNDSVIRAKNTEEWLYFREDLSQIPHTNGLNILFSPHGFYKVQKDSSQWLLYDFTSGENWFGTKYFNYYPQTRNLFSTFNGEAIGVIDANGKVKIPHEYDELTLAFFDSLFITHKAFNFGVVTLSNKVIIPLKHNSIKQINWFKPQYFFMALDSGSKMIYNIKGEIIVPPDYNDIKPNILPKFFKTLKGDFQSEKPPLVGAYSLNGLQLAEAKYNYELRLSPRFVAFSNQNETALFTEADKLGKYPLRQYTSYFDVLKCYSKDSLVIFYINQENKLKGRFDYKRTKSLKFQRELKTPDYAFMDPKIQPMPFTEIYFSQIHGKWGSKSNYRKKLNGKPKFIDVRKSSSGYVLVNNDSSNFIKIGDFKLLAQETLGTLTNYGAFNNNSIAFDYNYPTAETEKNGDKIHMASGIINDSTYKFTKYFGESNNEYNMILPNRHHSFLKVLKTGKPYITTKNPEISLEDFFNQYNDFGNLAPGDWNSNKLLSNHNMGIRFNDATFSIKMNKKTNLNVYGNQPFQSIKFLSKDLFSVNLEGKSFALRENDFRNKKTKDAALSKMFDEVNPIHQKTFFPKDTLHHGFTFKKKNQAYTFLNKDNKKRALQKYYDEIIDVYKDKIIVREGGFYHLIDFQERKIKSTFTAASKFTPNGFFKAKLRNKTWSVYNSLGKPIASKLKDVKISNQETFFIKTTEGYGLITSSGDTLLPCAYKFVKDYNKNGIAIIKQSGNYMLIDKKGKTLFQARKRFVKVIADQYIVYKKGGLTKLISYPTKKPIKTPNMNRIISIRDSVISYSSQDRKYFYSLKTKKKVLGRKVVRGYNENGFAVKNKNGNVYLINDQFEEILHLRRSKIEDKNGWILVYPFNEENHVYINYNGQKINLPTSYIIKSFKKNYAVFKDSKTQKLGVVKITGEIVLTPIYNSIRLGDKDEFIVRTDNGEGVININGKWIFKDAYGSISLINTEKNNLYAISPKNFTGFMYSYNQMAPPLDKFSVSIPPIYDKITFINQETLKIETYEGRFGYINFCSGKVSVIWDLNQ